MFCISLAKGNRGFFSPLLPRSSAPLLIFILLLIACGRGMRIDKSVSLGGTAPSSGEPISVGWFSLGGDFQRTGFYPQGITPPLQLIWKTRTPAVSGKSLTVVDGIIYLATQTGEVLSLRLADGKKQGGLKGKEGLVFGPTFSDGLLLWGTSQGKYTFTAYDLRRGRRLWQMNEGLIEACPAVAGGRVFIPSLDKHLICLRLSDGEVLWTFKTAKPSRSSPALGSGLVVWGDDAGWVYAVDALTGQMEWKLKTGGAVFSAPCILDSMVLVGSLDGTLCSLKLMTGESRWRFPTGSPIFGGAAAGKDRVVFGTVDGGLYALGAKSGELLWFFQTEGPINLPPVIADSLIFVVIGSGRLMVLGLSGGDLLWEYSTEGRPISAPAIYGNNIFCADDRGYIYAFRGE